jgi:hypothetical protein
MRKKETVMIGTALVIATLGTIYKLYYLIDRFSPCIPVPVQHMDCILWGVVTTIFEPSASILSFAERLGDTCVVVVGDVKTNHSAWRNLTNNVFYLDPSDQKALCYDILTYVPWNHFGRKNIGYLYAIAAGAKRIFDFDDDNQLKDGMETVLFADFGKCSMPPPIHLFYNPYPDFQDTLDQSGVAWPRGFPLEFIRDSRTHGQPRTWVDLRQKIAVVQSLADHDPDVDAIFRLTRHVPMNFATGPVTAIAVPIGTYTPWNAQATLFLESSFFGMLLPITVPGRVSDIWRSYITTRLLQETSMHVVFTTPLVDQYRNPHSYSADFEEETDLYKQVSTLIHILESTNTTFDAGIPDVYLHLMRELVTGGILRQRDYNLAQAWVSDLHRVGYTWPDMQPRRQSPHLHMLTDSRIFDGRLSKSHSIETSLSKTFWTSDLHDGTRLDFTTMLMQLGHTVRNMGHKGSSSPYPEFIRKMLPPSRPLSNVITSLVKHSSGMTEANAREFFEYYKNDTDMLETDAFMCHFPASFCEIYLPFNRSIIISASHRLFIGRCSIEESNRLVQHLRSMLSPGAAQRHFIFGSNKYDAEYITHFTGLHVPVLPASSYGYQHAAYAPKRVELLVGPLQIAKHKNLWEMNMVGNGSWTFSAVKALYPRFTPQDICNHRAVVLLPYAVHSYGITEVFSLSIPIFAPSIDFALELGLFIDKNVNDDVYCGKSFQPPAADPASPHPFSPEDRSTEAQYYWLQFADLYQYPHIQYFQSWENLVMQLDTTDFHAIHLKMTAYNSKRRVEIEHLLARVAEEISPRGIVREQWSHAIAPWGPRLMST